MVQKKQIVLLFMVSILLFLTACGSYIPSFGRENTNRNYYSGTEGVRFKFSDPGNPPSYMYYYQGGSRDENTFYVFVDVHNLGASWTKGGVYVSGYDPSMIRFKEIDIPRTGGGWQDCIFNIDFLGSTVGGAIDCSDTGFHSYWEGSDNYGVSISRLGTVLEAVGINGLTNDENIDEFISNIGLSYNQVGGTDMLSFQFGDNFDFDYLNHGGMLAIVFSDMSFERYNGQEFILRGNSPSFPGGESDMLSFTGTIENWPRGLDRTDTPITFLVTGCYLYSTYAAPQVCIDPAPNDAGRKVCRPRKYTYNGGNGAPIIISSIEQENAGRKVFFEINFKNSKSETQGRIYDLKYMERCSPYYPGRLSLQHMNVVYVTDVRIGNHHLRCTPDRGSGVRMVNGQGSIRCEYDMQYVTAKSAYETPLTVEISYGYSEYIERRTTIRRV